MTYKRILIAEDSPSVGKLICDVLMANGYQVTLATNGRDALNHFATEPFPVVITDIEMPIMDGNEFIDHLKCIDESTSIIVETVHKEISMIIETMRKGVYDYLVKPFDIEDLLLKIERAFEVAELKMMKKTLEKERMIRCDSQLEWYKWQDSVKDRSTYDKNKSLFKNLLTSMNQGAGFGSLVTLINLISTNSKEENGHYIIESDLFNIVKENAKMTEKALKAFSDIEHIEKNELDFHRISCDGIYNEIVEIKNGLNVYTTSKNQWFLLSDRKIFFSEKYVEINMEYFRKAINEIIINALKYSRPNSAVTIIFDCINKELNISVVNDPIPDDEGRVGIPLGYENIIFEPFFRMTKTVQEEYTTLDYGLGLTLVDKIINKHNGKISATNIVDHSIISNKPTNKVTFNISIPCNP
ncbi:MAG: response regulator [Spirochaetota bacterium]|nr:response regulator [Spirochaetota bacterium]